MYDRIKQLQQEAEELERLIAVSQGESDIKWLEEELLQIQLVIEDLYLLWEGKDE